MARRIAAHFNLPLFGKDVIKETLFDTLGWSDRARSKQLSHASIALLYRMLEIELAAGRACMLESNFDSELAATDLQAVRARYPFNPLQIQCTTDPEELLARLRHRTAIRERHPGHVDALWVPELRPETIPWRSPPIEIGGPVIELDTTDFDAIDYDELFAEIARYL